MDLQLKGKTAIVTDATCDIGKSVAIDLSLEGVELLLCSPNKSKLKKLSEEIKATGGRASYYCFDGTDKEEVEKSVEEINKKSEKINILINNIGGIEKLKPFSEVEEKEWLKIMSLNLYSNFYFTKSIIPLLKKSKSSRIINISSLSGIEPGVNTAFYNLSKSAIINLTKSLSKELAPYNILVNSVCPGPVYTHKWEKLCEQLSNSLGISSEDIMNIFGSNLIPLGKIARPEEISPLIVFLASEKASYITGTNICIDGGLSSSIF